MKQQVDGRLPLRSAGRLGEKERAQRMVLGKAMLIGFRQTRRRYRTGDECDADGLELFRWQGLRREACPETVPVAGDRRESCDPAIAHQVVDLGTIDVSGAVIAAAKAGVAGAGPWPGQMRRQMLRVGTKVECAERIAPDLPRGRGGLESIEKPRFLRAPEYHLRRLILAEVRDLLVTVANRCRRMAARIGATRIQDLHRFLRN